MTSEQIRQFLDSMTYEDAIMLYKDYAFECCGMCYNSKTKTYSMHVDKLQNPDDSNSPYLGTVFEVQGKSKEECLTQFVEAKFWEGKSFWEVAKELKWW